MADREGIDMTEATPEEDCWIWHRSINASGYGTVRVGDKVEMAHRVAWSDANGPIPLGHEIDHTCGVRACVNPGHLELTTSSENNRRRYARVRTGGGSVRLATTASLQIKQTASGLTRYKVRFRDYLGGKAVDRSRTFDAEPAARTFMESIGERPIYDLCR